MNCSSENNTNHDLDYINILHDEWKFRLSQYWSLTSKTICLSFVLFFIPYMKDAWGVNMLNLSNQIFPIAGIIFSIIACLLSTIEMNKINIIKGSIKKYILIHAQQIDIPYNYSNPIHQHLPIVICCAQVIVGVFVIINVS